MVSQSDYTILWSIFMNLLFCMCKLQYVKNELSYEVDFLLVVNSTNFLQHADAQYLRTPKTP